MFGELELDDDVAADNQMKYLNTMTIKLLAVFKNIESSFFLYHWVLFRCIICYDIENSNCFKVAVLCSECCSANYAGVGTLAIQ